MGLLIIKGRDGQPRPTWYGRISVKGSRRDTNLNVPIEGTIPVNEAGSPVWNVTGDAAFERSKKAAQKAFDAWRKEVQKDPAELAEKAYRARTGEKLGGVTLTKLAEKWDAQKRTYTPTADWSAAVHKWFERFATFAHKYAADHGTRCDTINDVTPDLAAAWFDDIRAAFTWETVCKQMSLMRAAFRRHATNGKKNPFEDITMRNREIGNARVSRKPLTATEVQRLFECAREDDFVYPLIVTAACTGARIGDVCNLKWEDIDLSGGFIDVMTAKTGVRVTIPIFGRLREVLEDCAPVPGDGEAPSPFVFPSAAKTYATNPDAIYKASKPYFARAVFGDEKEATPTEIDENGKGVEPKPLAEVIETAGFSEAKRTRMIEIYNRFKAGQKSIDIAAALGVARSQVSMDLADAEKLTGEKLRPRSMATANRKTRAELIERTRAARGIGKRRASVFGWHSLRHSFVVLAVEAGVGLGDVQKIVGHTTSATTEQYFNPEKKHAAERVKKQMRGSVLDGDANTRPAIENAPNTPVVTAAPSIDDFIGSLSEAQRKALAARLLGL